MSYRLLKRQTTTHCERLLFCNSCLQHTHLENIMEKHKMECGKIVTTMPKAEDSILRFKSHHRKIDVPFVVYADFECVLQQIDFSVSSKTK